ncbi:nuclear pore complex protein Nup205-like isoform X2 [Anneissia japonica]|uniref:nuclear pore complex protein Nup205-like isoform X2 n=1 Tax=Anneissia japonica TaxID=1529436 RepID=UPI0014258DC5|nr:nuclear pore complex protein Nup205-like isoform X2 [Anneissia japonica]
MAASGSVAVNLVARQWSPYKELCNTVDTAITQKTPDSYYDLEVALRKYKPDFISLLKNPAKNLQHREKIKKANKEGIVIEGQPGTKTLPTQFIEESLIISDLFDLNEYSAVELLLAGEQQQPHYPGIPRGLVAVLLYYDGRRSIVNALHLLIQSRKGRTWTLELDEEMMLLTTKFTNDLLKDGLVDKILRLLLEFLPEKEIEKLAKQRAIGSFKHRHQVMELLKEIRCSLSECLFSLACQTPLDKANTMALMDYLKKNAALTADGTVDDETLTLLISFMYCAHVGVLETDAESRNDKSYILEIQESLISDDVWAVPAVKSTLQFVWAVMLRNIAQQSDTQDLQELIEADEMLMDMALEGNAFKFLLDTITKKEHFHDSEFQVRRFHALITDFIVQMPLKIKELRNRGDEAARILLAHAQEGVEPPVNLPRHFEYFMRLISALYRTDPLSLELAAEFWCPSEHTLSPSRSSYLAQFRHRPSNRQVSLFKFIRMAGDLLPPSLYVPYIAMLTGLATGPICAHHCFNLLKVNGAAGGGSVTSVSWDHFFQSLSRYYANLRQEAGASNVGGQTYRHISGRGITPQELEGLVTVLKLVQTVAEWDEEARIGLCENRSWLPIVLLLGIVTCSVPPLLKAECLKALANFAKTPELAANLWQALENSQILPTLDRDSATGSGIPLDLEIVESRNEEFPLTIGFLEFMSCLVDIPIPDTLGSGLRAPGFDPYLEFLRDQVFLKFHTRAYRDTKEKWEVASKSLKIFHKLLRDHDPSIEDFMDQVLDIQGGGKTVANKPAGHHLLLHLLNDSHLLKLMLFIIHEARRLLDQYKPFPGKEHLESAALYCLKMIDIALEKQEKFFDLVRSQSLGVMVTPMDQLLMSINPKTGKADHLVNIAKFVSHATTHPEHALVSVRVLLNVVKTSNIQSQIVGFFTVDEAVSKELIIGFVDCLETEDHEEEEGEIPQNFQDIESMDVTNIRNATRLFIMQLLLFSLGQPAPNLAHLLLGFDIQKPISKSNLQDPGVLGSPRTCLHAILCILERGIGKGSRLTSIHTMPKLADLCYEMVYQICSNRETCIPIMRYLGMTHNFFYRHLRHIPFVNGIGQNTSEKLLLNQQAWLLKSVAVEIRLTSVNRQRSNTQRLLKLLLEDVPSPVVDRDDNDEDGYGETNQSILETTVGQQVGPSITGMQIRRKILQVLDSIDLTQDYPGTVQLDLLDPTVTEQLIKSCEQQTDRGMTVCNIHALHRELMGRLNAQQGPAVIGNRPRILQEIQAILKNVVECNLTKEMAAAKRHSLDAWRHVVETLFVSCSQDLLPLELRETILLELIQELLTKVADDATVPELTAPVSGILVSLMTNLHQCAVIGQSKSIPEQLSTQYVHMLDGSVVHGSGSTFGSSGVMTSTVLSEILRKLLTFLVQSTTGQLRVRSNLYGALMNFLQMPQKVQEIPTLKGRNVLDSRMLTEYEKMTAASLAVISEFGDSFMDLVCRDACDGHDVGRMLALSLIDSILATDKQHRWLHFLNSKGYLRHLIQGLVQEDQALQNMLKPTPEPLRALYIYESKMSLLTRLGETPIGAEALLQQGIMGRLSECQFLELRPERDISRRGEGGDALQVDAFIPTVLHRYRQLLFPVLRLCVAIMTSLGGQHKEAANQILRFVFSHSELFTAILRDYPSRLTVEAFQELSLTTAVICRTAADVDYYGGSPYDEIGKSQLVIQGHLSRIQRQILALVPRYCIHDHWNKQLKMASQNEIKEEDKEKIRLALLEINSNIIAYCRSEVTSAGVTGSSCTVLFTPSLSEALARDYHQVTDIPMASLSATKPPSLGIIVRHLRQVANTFLPSLDAHQQMVHKLSNITELSSEELKEIIKPVITDGIEKLSASYRQQVASRKLAQVIRLKAQELALKYYILENCLFLIWRHLEFYLIHCQPADSNHSLLPPLMTQSHQARDLADPFNIDGSGTEGRSLSSTINQTNNISKGDIEQLKEEAVNCLTESLLQKFRDVEAQYGKTVSRYSFVSVLARRIHRLLTIGIQTELPIR